MRRKTIRMILPVFVFVFVMVSAFILLPCTNVSAEENTVQLEVGISSSESFYIDTTSLYAYLENNTFDDSMMLNIEAMSNNPNGFGIYIQDEDEDSSMVNYENDEYTIPSGASSMDGSVSEWGVMGGDVTDWNAVPTYSDTALPLFYTDMADAQQLEVRFGVSVDAQQAPGDYADTVIISMLSNI